MDEPRSLTRRDALTGLGGLGLGLVVVACSGGGPAATATSGATTTTGGATGTGTDAKPGAAIADPTACVLTPEVTEGPYFIDGDAVRSDITEGRPGAPLDLRIRVVDATSCRPVDGASVDIWHCDAGGVYSGFTQASRGAGGGGGGSGGGGSSTDSARFLRGIQMTDPDGGVAFATVYPGWYPGRAVHIHVKVGVAGQVHTGQIFFDDAQTDAVHRSSPYDARGTRDLRNADDSIFGQTPNTIAAVTTAGSGYRGTITLAVRG